MRERGRERERERAREFCLVDHEVDVRAPVHLLTVWVFGFRVSFGFSGFGLRPSLALQIMSISASPCTCSPFCAPAFGFQIQGFGFQASGFGFRVSGSRLRVSGSRLRVSDFGFQTSVSGLSDFRIRISGFGFRLAPVRPGGDQS